MIKKALSFALVALAIVFLSGSKVALAKGEVTLDALRHKVVEATFESEGLRYQRDLYDGTLMSYFSDGLKVFALVNRPNTSMPDAGYPVLIFGHGFHPEPKKYGISSNGEISRPGDYYRGIPERYAERGFVAITPDYRGHNRSEGIEFTKTSFLASSYYASDVLHVLSALSSLDNVDVNRIYYLGHSMGGDVGLKVLLSSNKIRAASLWSPVVATTDQQAFYYGRYYDEDKNVAVDQQKLNDYRKKIDDVYASLPAAISDKDIDAINYLDQLNTPLIIHHARGDSSVPYQWSENLVIEMSALGKEFLFYTYETENHLFKGENLNRAFERDLDFFSKH